MVNRHGFYLTEVWPLFLPLSGGLAARDLACPGAKNASDKSTGSGPQRTVQRCIKRKQKIVWAQL